MRGVQLAVPLRRTATIIPAPCAACLSLALSTGGIYHDLLDLSAEDVDTLASPHPLPPIPHTSCCTFPVAGEEEYVDAYRASMTRLADHWHLPPRCCNTLPFLLHLTHVAGEETLTPTVHP